MDNDIERLFSETSLALKNKDVPLLIEKYNELKNHLIQYPDKESPEYHHYYVNTYALHEAIIDLHNGKPLASTTLSADAQPAVQAAQSQQSTQSSQQPTQTNQATQVAQNIQQTQPATQTVDQGYAQPTHHVSTRTVWIIILIVSGVVILGYLLNNILFAPYIPNCDISGPFRCSEYGMYSSALSPNANYVIVKFNQGLFSSQASNISIDKSSVAASGCANVYFDSEHSLKYTDELMLILDCDNTQKTVIDDPIKIDYFDGSKVQESVLTMDIQKATRAANTDTAGQITQ